MSSEITQSANYSKELLLAYQSKINPLIVSYFAKQKEYVKATFNDSAFRSVEVFEDICTRGAKRARGAFSYYVYKMYGGKNDTEALKMGIVLELVHAYLLLLDDFMDRSALRRGGPTAHVLMNEYYSKQGFRGGDPSHFGDSIAVTIGAAGFHMAMDLLMSLDFSSDILKALSNNLNEKIEITAFGQITDVVNSHNPNVTEDDVLKMLEWKTGVYTYENPIHTGAIMAGNGNKEELSKLSEYALPAGIAFQIQDDILGIFGNSGDTGKSVYDDLREGKYTLLMHHALEVGSKEQVEVLRANLGNQSAGERELNDVKTILVESGSLEYSKNKAKELVLKAKDSLEKNRSPRWEDEGYKYLVGIADYMIDRKL